MIELPEIEYPEALMDKLEEEIDRVFREEIYMPMIRELNQTFDSVMNSRSAFLDAIKSGRIWFARGRFKGRFNGAISKELRELGAKWDKKENCFRLLSSDLPSYVKQTIDLSDFNFKRKTEIINKFLANLDPEKIAEKVNTQGLFDTMLFKVEKEFEKNVKNISVAPNFTPNTIKRISEEYTKNAQLYIKDFTKKETLELRERMQERVFAGERYEGMIKNIEDSYGVSQNKAKFLARQESKLLMVKYTQSRYQEAGVNEYRWSCVAGSPNHPVRPMHLKNKDKIYTWDNPPIVDDKGNRKNPGQDYNCRCKAIPVVRF